MLKEKDKSHKIRLAQRLHSKNGYEWIRTHTKDGYAMAAKVK